LGFGAAAATSSWWTMAQEGTMADEGVAQMCGSHIHGHAISIFQCFKTPKRAIQKLSWKQIKIKT
jgi:hypothetical protein